MKDNSTKNSEVVPVSLSDYPLFQGISGENLKTLLPCLNARVQICPTGSDTTWDPAHVGLVINGKLSFSDSPTEIAPGDTISSDRSLRLRASEGTTILKLDKNMIDSPCWFSCSFHYRVAENVKHGNMITDKR